MAEDPLGGAEDEFREMMRKFLAGEGDIDPSKLAGIHEGCNLFGFLEVTRRRSRWRRF